jgi:SAM-dependent methyltransferase
MPWIFLDPPGELCQIQAVCDCLARPLPRTFLEAGCGGGSLSRELCRRGLRGVGVDPSSEAIAVAGAALAPDLSDGRYRLIAGELEGLDPAIGPFDLAVSMMTIEHLADDVGFVRLLANYVRPGGQVIVGVPGRPELWSCEDDLAGHLRRYTRQDLARVLTAAGVEGIEVRSVAVPIANLLRAASNWLVRRSAGTDELRHDQRTRTLHSGVRRVPLKTVFPAPFRLLLNRHAMAPGFVLQRAFYKSDLGLTLLATGRVPGPSERDAS